MRLCLDTNVLLATIIDDDATADVATTLLDSDAHEFVVSTLTLMELRAVLTKQERLPRDEVEAIIADILRDVSVYIPDRDDMTAAANTQRSTLLYPMDAVILTCAEAANATLVTFDAELLEHGAVTPDSVLE